MSTSQFEDPLFRQPGTAGTDFEDMLAAIMPGFPQFRAERREQEGAFKWKAELAVNDSVTLLRARYNAPWVYTPQTDHEMLGLRFCTTGASETSIRGEEIIHVPGTAIVTSSAEVGRTTVRTDTRMNLATSATFIFNAALVNTCLYDMFELTTLGQLGIRPLIDLSTPIGRTLITVCRSMAQGLAAERVLQHSPKAMTLMAEAVVRLVLEHGQHRFSGDLRKRLIHVVPRHVKKAIDFMHENMHRPIRLADIASAAGVSARTLQIGFKQFRETTPLIYLQQIRLQAVHRELSSAENTLSIRDVALKWGFSHMGRFSAQYKAAFGASPSTTVNRG
ncbi:helix-turn-helix transcriptional regulator [Roseibium salinum]|uniref:AraC family transcriptional regulator n=1 Tax=Roseibium salinum TaxID=1604349 RepID=A0ABT3QX08_9HYPH|nr:AraC family transcriptional regulator [Roseibium sp. DSM 29163]MCX2721468.1 AraC family transcriptional regulator [Roseibium sp. DSM 29163]